MNTPLVNSIAQLIFSLPLPERQLLLDLLDRHFRSPNPQPEPPAPQSPLNTEQAWELWYSLGNDAVIGTLDNTSTQHDVYLYPDS